MDDKETIRKLAHALAPFATAATKGYVLYDAVKTTVDNDLYKSHLLSEPTYAAMYKANAHLCWRDFLNVMELLSTNDEVRELIEEYQHD